MNTQAMNHPKRHSVLKVEPVRAPKDIKLLKKHLGDHQRNLTMFTMGINTNLRASDLVKLKIGDIKYLEPGDHFLVREKKTKKMRRITVNKTVYAEVQKLLAEMPEARDEDFLFQSRKKKGALTVSYFSRLCKSWMTDCNIRGKHASHSLRKTFGFAQRTVFKTDIPTLMRMFNHSSQKQTLEYLGIQEEEISEAYMHEI